MSDKDKEQQEEQGNKKLYPKSFRITDDVYKAFKDISKNFSNQDEALKQLCQCYELNSNSSNLPTDIQTDIQKFNNCVGVLKGLYISSLEYSNIIKDSESEKYKVELDLKDKAISDLEDTINRLKNDKEALDSQLKDLSQTNNLTKQELEQLQEELSSTISDFQEKLKDKDNLNNMLSTKVKGLENEINLLNSKINSYTELQSENKDLKEQLEENKKEIEKLKLENDKKLLEVKEEYNKKYEDMNNNHKKEIELYSQKYKDLLKEIEKISKTKIAPKGNKN